MKKDSQALNQEWHERKMLIEMLNEGPMTVSELIENIREQQKKLSALGQKVQTHPDNNAYIDWINELKDTHLVSEDGTRILLTPLGKWLLSSTCISTLKERYLFIKKITCAYCHKAGFASVLIIKPDTAYKDPRSRILIMAVECPKCHLAEQQGLTENLTASQFNNLYNLVLSDLKKNVRLMPQLILPR